MIPLALLKSPKGIGGIAAGLAIIGIAIWISALRSKVENLEARVEAQKAEIASWSRANDLNVNAIEDYRKANEAINTLKRADEKRIAELTVARIQAEQRAQQSERRYADAVRKDRAAPACANLLDTSIADSCPTVARRLQDAAARRPSPDGGGEGAGTPGPAPVDPAGLRER